MHLLRPGSDLRTSAEFSMAIFLAPFSKPEHHHVPDDLKERSVGRARAKVLSIGNDPVLMYSRRLVFESDGYEVASLRSDAVLHDEQLQGFDLVVLCHSIPDKVAGHLLSALGRSAPFTPVLLITSFDNPGLPNPHCRAVCPDPATMLATAAQQMAHAVLPSRS